MKNLIYITLMTLAPMFLFAQNSALKIIANDNVGIGIDTPTQKLDVNGNANVRGNFLNVGQNAAATAAYLRVGYGRTASGTAAIDCIGTTASSYGFRFGYTGAGNSIMFHRGTNPFLIQATEAASIYFRTASTNRVAITSTGRMSIGTTNPNAAALLDVNGVVRYTGTLLNTSDKRLKTNTTEFDYGLDEVLSLSPISYNYNGKAGTDAEQTHVGIYAQDLRKVAPELVGEFKHEETEIEVIENGAEVDVRTKTNKSSETYLHINESSIKYMLINAVKEQQDIIETQDEKIATLEEKLANIEALLSSQNTDLNRQNIQLDGSGAYLEQNQPNPFNDNTLIRYNVPSDVKNALVNIFDMNGQLIYSEFITQTGRGEIQLKAGTVAAGTYSYSLVVDGQILDTKRMVIAK